MEEGTDDEDPEAQALARRLATLVAEVTSLDRLERRLMDVPDNATRALVARAEAEAFAMFCQDLATLLAQLDASVGVPDAGEHLLRGVARPRMDQKGPQ